MDSSKITSIVCTSAIPLHPDTRILDECIAGIRHHLPDSSLLVVADGVWDGIKHRKNQYEEYLDRIEHKYPNSRLIRFQQHTQQTAMCQYAIQNFVQTKLIWWNEHDAPLRIDREIDWDSIVNEVESGNAGLVRFSYFEEGIHEAHEHLTRGRYHVGTGTFVRTLQFSGWCFLSTVQYFVNKIFTGQPIGKEMLEIRKYQDVANSPWEEYKNVIWLPEGLAQRFRHSNGRGAGVEIRDACDWEGK